MIKYLLIILAVFQLNLIQGQNHNGISMQDSIKIEKLLTVEIDNLKIKLLKENKLEQQITFTLDTFQIERKMELQLEKDYSTAGMFNAGGTAIESYDALLNKYYSQLINVLDKEDQNVLKQAQRDWLRYRDSELEFNGTFTAFKNTGGGTMYGPLALSRELEITRQRLREIFSYIHLILVTRG